MGFDLFAVSPHGDITSALNIDQDLSGMGGSPQAADLTIAPDWKRIVLYTEFEDDHENDPETLDLHHVLPRGHSYQQCGTSKHAKAPDPANFQQLRGGY
jgi:hypothetical protein